MSEEILDTKDEDFDDEQSEDQEGGGGKAKKIALFVIVPLLILSGVGVGLYTTGMLDGLMGDGKDSQEVAESQESGKNEKINFNAVFLPMPDIVVNLKTENNQTRFLRLRVQLELENEAQKEAVTQVMPRVVDQFQTYLREMRVKDLKGSAGIYRLQKELIARVNTAAYPVEVKDVLFQEMLVQ